MLHQHQHIDVDDRCPRPAKVMDHLFEAERLQVRYLMASDFAFFHEMQADDLVMQYTTGSGLSESENHRQLNDCIAAYSRPNNDFWVWAIVLKTNMQFIGTCAIVPNSDRPEIGYRFLRKYFGHGYGQEICDALIEYGINTLKLNEIIAFVDTRNIASRKILDRSVLPFAEELPNSDGGIDRFYRWSGERPTSEMQ